MAPAPHQGGRGEATLWEALPNTVSENKTLVEAFRADREEAYRELITTAERLKQKATLGADRTLLLEELEKIEREFRAERRRDYFRSPLRGIAESTLRETRQSLREGACPAAPRSAEEG